MLGWHLDNEKDGRRTHATSAYAKPHTRGSAPPRGKCSEKAKHLVTLPTCSIALLSSLAARLSSGSQPVTLPTRLVENRALVGPTVAIQSCTGPIGVLWTHLADSGQRHAQ